METEIDRTAILLGGDDDASVLPEAWRHGRGPIRILEANDAAQAAEFQHLIVVTAATGLARVARATSEANRRNRLAGLLVRRDHVADAAVPYLFAQANLRVLRKLLIHEGRDIPRRIFRAWALEAPADFIAAAYVLRDSLLVYDCEFGTHEIAFDAYPALAAIPRNARKEFSIEDDGYLLHWPSTDVLLDLDAIRNSGNEEMKALAREAQQYEERDLGDAIRKLRKSHGLAQSAIPGISSRHVRRMEQGMRVTNETLHKLATAHRMTPHQYLAALTELMPPSGHERSRSVNNAGTQAAFDDVQVAYTSSVDEGVTPRTRENASAERHPVNLFEHPNPAPALVSLESKDILRFATLNAKLPISASTTPQLIASNPRSQDHTRVNTVGRKDSATGIVGTIGGPTGAPTGPTGMNVNNQLYVA